MLLETTLHLLIKLGESGSELGGARICILTGSSRFLCTYYIHTQVYMCFLCVKSMSVSVLLMYAQTHILWNLPFLCFIEARFPSSYSNDFSYRNAITGNTESSKMTSCLLLWGIQNILQGILSKHFYRFLPLVEWQSLTPWFLSPARA